MLTTPIASVRRKHDEQIGLEGRSDGADLSVSVRQPGASDGNPRSVVGRAMNRRRGAAIRTRWLGWLAIGLLAASSCGKKGPPRPPEPRGPLPPRKIEVRQLGAQMVVAFQIPEPRGSQPAQAPARAELVRVEYGPGLEAPSDPDTFRRRGTVVRVFGANPLQPGTRATIDDPSWTRLVDGGVGWTLRYAVRVRDQRGRPSPLVVARDIIAVAIPEPPRGLTAEPTADGIRAVWSPPADEGSFRYNLYRADDEGVYPERPLNGQPLETSEFLDTSAEIGKTYRYGVRTSVGEPPPFTESATSAEVIVVAEDRFAPAAPEGLVAVQEGEAIRLFWDPGQERDLEGYRVYRRIDSSAWESVGPSLVPEPLYLDTEVEPGQRVVYRVTAVDRATPPNEGPASSVVEVLVAEDRGGTDGERP